MRYKTNTACTVLCWSIILMMSTKESGFSHPWQENCDLLNLRGTTRLHKVASEHNLEEARQLISAGQSPTSTDSHGWTPFHIAAEKNDPEMVEALFTNQQDDPSKLLMVRNELGDTPFHIAAYNGHAKVLAKLIEKYPEGKNLEGYKGFRPIHTAASEGHVDVVKLLYEANAQMDLLNQAGHTVLHLIQLMRDDTIKANKYKQYDQIISYLVEKAPRLLELSAKDIGTPLHYAASKYDGKSQLQTLLQKSRQRIDINCRDHNGDTPLHVAASRGSTDSVIYLLEQKADMHARTNLGGMVLHCAARREQVLYDIIKFLNRNNWNYGNIFDYHNINPRDLVTSIPRIIEGTQIKGSSSLTSQRCQVSLYFTKSKTCYNVKIGPINIGIPGLHANIVFESLNSLNKLDGDTKNISYLRFTDLQGKKGKRVLEGAKAFNQVINIHGKRIERFYSWEIDATTADRAWRFSNNSNTSFSWTGYTCVDHALQILRECNITLPSFNHVRGVNKILPEHVIEKLDKSKT